MTTANETQTQTSPKKSSPVIKAAIIVAVSIVAVFGLRACYIAKGAYHHSKSPELKFVGDIGERSGVPVFRVSVAFELQYQPMDGRRAFVEILPDEDYTRKKDEKYVGGWGEHQGSWGGVVVDASYQNGRVEVRVPPDALPGEGERKFWVRTAVFSDNTYREKDSSFDRVIYGLVGKPIDYKNGFYFLNEGGENRRYYASRYYPFILVSGVGAAAPSSGISSTSPQTSGVPKAASSRRVTAGMFTFEVPSDWEVLSGSEERQAKREIEASVKQMLDRYTGSSADRSLLGIQSLKAVRMPSRAGWFIAYTTRIPPQQNYLATIEQEQEQKLLWGKQQGIVTRVVEHGRSKVGDADVIKVDSEMRQGARTIGIYHWSLTDPGNVGTITVVVNPGYYSGIRSALDAVMASLQIEKAGK